MSIRFPTSFCLVCLLGAASQAQAQLAGTWQLYPANDSAYSVSPQQPINSDGTSNFKASKGVIPVKFSLSVAPGPIVFQSIGSDTDTANDYSFLSFTPAGSINFSQLTNLSAVFTFSEGDCHGGSLRWQVRFSPTEAIFIYYGEPPQFGNGGVGGCAPNLKTGDNLLSLTDLRFDTSQLAGGTFYDSYENALTLAGTRQVLRASLVLDSGWGGDQVVNPLTSATVNDNTFTPVTGDGVPTCDLPPATIQVTKTAGTGTGPVNEPITIQPNDDDGAFRVIDCKYAYNLATSSLSGPGRYRVEVLINGNPASGGAEFDLR